MSYSKGIDVSTNNGVIDWAKVKASGVTFAMIKASQGYSLSGKYHNFTDGQFKRNIVQAAASGISCGVYHYLTAKTTAEAQTEAKYFVSAIAPYKSRVKLWAAVDVEEDKYLPTDKTLLTSIVMAFCTTVKAAGYKPCVYTNPNYLKYRLNGIGGYPLWLALWRDVNLVPAKADYPTMVMWQYGGGSVPGVSGDCDVNLGIDASLNTAQAIDYATLVCKKCGFEAQTRAYIDKYKYASDLWRKLYEQMS